MNKIFFYVALLLLSATNHAATLKQSITDLATSHNFNGSILVAKKGEIVLHQHIGYADNEKKVKLNQAHQFSSGSIGKEFTTVSIMQLVEQGKLNYSDLVAQFVPELPKSHHNISILHILNHTSGLNRIKWHHGITTADALAQLKTTELAFSPGTRYLYSNLNVLLRAIVVEKITQQPYDEYLTKTIFQPLGMTTAKLITSANKAQKTIVSGDYPTYLNGITIYLSALDLLKFEQALWRGDLIKTEHIKRYLPGDTWSGKDNRAQFDFGIYYASDKTRLTAWQHDGSNPSHHALKYHHFEKQLAIILLSSDGNKSTLFKLKDTIIDEL